MLTYHPSGAFSSRGLLTLLAAACGGGLVGGALLGFVSGWIRLVILFPLVMGMVVAGAGIWGLRSGKVRAPLVAALLAGMGVLLGSVTERAWEYHRARRAMRGVWQEQELTPEQAEEVIDRALVALGRSTRSEAEQKVAFEEELTRPQSPARLDVWWSWWRWRLRSTTLARAGSGSHSSDAGMGLAGGSVLWGVELLIALGTAMAGVYVAAGEPFCESCEEWYGDARVVASLPGHWADQAKQALEQDDGAALARVCGAESKIPPFALVQVRRCECPDRPWWAQVLLHEKNAKGEVKNRTLCAGLVVPAVFAPLAAAREQPPEEDEPQA